MDKFMILLRAVLEIAMALMAGAFLIDWLGIWAAGPVIVAFCILCWYTDGIDEEDLL